MYQYLVFDSRIGLILNPDATQDEPWIVAISPLHVRMVEGGEWFGEYDEPLANLQAALARLQEQGIVEPCSDGLWYIPAGSEPRPWAGFAATRQHGVHLLAPCCPIHNEAMQLNRMASDRDVTYVWACPRGTVDQSCGIVPGWVEGPWMVPLAVLDQYGDAPMPTINKHGVPDWSEHAAQRRKLDLEDAERRRRLP